MPPPAPCLGLLSDLPHGTVSDPRAPLFALGVEALWSKLARESAPLDIGTPGAPLVDAQQASALLADLLPYPEHSRARSPKADANVRWWAHSKLALSAVKTPDGLPIKLDRIPGLASPYPPVFISERIAALGRVGADPAKARALMRAAFRKCPEEILAVLGLPGCPTPGTLSLRGGSALHRASYQGPNHIFVLLANASEPLDWISLDDKGRMPIDMACQSGNLGRSLACARLMPWNMAPTDAAGDTPLHRLARSLGDIGAGKSGDYAAWSKLFSELAVQHGPDCFFAPNKSGHSPVDLAGLQGLRDALLMAQSQAGKAAIAMAADMPEASARARRRRI